VGQAVCLAARSPPGTALEPAALLRAVRRLVPEYMVPRAVIPYPAIPRTPNGKVDRAGLRAAHAGLFHGEPQ
jgi:acyl-CoA synthetase (AMP-forming)/AMP-acid ligase II